MAKEPDGKVQLLDGTELPYEILGGSDRCPLIWGHGLGPTDPRGMDHRACESFPLVKEMMQEDVDKGKGTWPFSTVVYDARGHGRSSGWEPLASCIQQFHWRSLAFDMLSVASNFQTPATQKLRGALLGGYSMGASTALWAAYLCPTAVRGLVLLSVTTAWEIRAARRANLLNNADVLQASDPAASEVVRGAAFSDLPPLDDLAAAKLRIPVLLCAARDDTTHPAEVAERLSRVLPNADVFLKDTKTELAQEFPQHLRSWLQQHFQDKVTFEESFLGNLFNWTSPPADSGCGARGSGSTPPPSYSFEKLQQLYNRLAQFRESDLEKSGEGDALIETVRQITEALIWGEQANHSQFFDFFCEKSIFSDLVHVLGLKKASKKVKLQLLQTLSMLIQNIHRQTSVYYILSNNHVNKLMSTNMDFDDEEVLAYYITLMKSLAMRLDNESIKFFFIQHPEPSFPLYIEATKFFSHRDHMVRATVRTITLQVYKIEDQPMRRFVLRHAAESYFSQLAYHLQDLWLRLDAAAAKATGEDNLSQVQRENELQQDLQIYLSDVFELGIEELNEVLADRLLNAAILPVLLAGLTTSSSQRIGGAARTLAPHVSLFLVRQVLDTFHCPVLLEPMAQALLWSSVPAALAYAP
ncbi:CLEC16A [Symbiodinium sp. CCMP2592]|nr:CLEC16A [Symbiodinium sp. CCMP2592]